MFGGWGCSPFWSGGLFGNGFWGIGLLGMGINLVVWILLIALIIYLFRKLFGTGFRKPAFSGRDESLNILRERYARGEIDTEEYERRKQDLHR